MLLEYLLVARYIEAIFSFCEAKTNGTRKCGVTILVIVLQKQSGSTVRVA